MITHFFASAVSGLLMRAFATPVVDRAIGPRGWNTVSHQAVGVVLAYPALEAMFRAVYAMAGGEDARRAVEVLRACYFLSFFWTGIGVVVGWLLDAMGGER